MDKNGHPLALVTGAAHRLGRAFAIALAKRGYAIMLHYYRSERDARATSAQIESLGVPVILVQADLTDEREIEKLFTAVDISPFPLQLLINSAAVMIRGDVWTSPVSEWDITFRLNLRAPFLCSREAARRMEKGLIINISDVGARKVWKGFPAYTVSKSALESLTRVMAYSLAPNIRVNAIAPSFVIPSTDISETGWDDLVKRVPLGRNAYPEEVVSAVEYLIQNEYITGQTIVIDGGYSLVG